MGQNLKINFFKISQNKKKNVKILKMGQNFENRPKFKKKSKFKISQNGSKF